MIIITAIASCRNMPYILQVVHRASISSPVSVLKQCAKLQRSLDARSAVSRPAAKAPSPDLVSGQILKGVQTPHSGQLEK